MASLEEAREAVIPFLATYHVVGEGAQPLEGAVEALDALIASAKDEERRTIHISNEDESKELVRITKGTLMRLLERANSNA